MSLTNVAVLRGGDARTHAMSLISGQSVIDALELHDKYNPIDIFVDKNFVWHNKGLPIKPFDILDKVDLVFNTLYGEYGASGKLQNLLEQSNVPFTGPKSFTAGITYNRSLSLLELKKNKDLLPKLQFQEQYFINIFDLLDKDLLDIVNEIFQKMSPPYVLKPIKSDNSFGVAYAETQDDLINLISKMLPEFEELVVEEYIEGQKISVSLLENFRGKDVYSTPTLEIKDELKSIKLYENAFIEAEESKVRFPANIKDALKEDIEELAVEIFKILNLRHYARIDFAVNKFTNKIYFLKAHALPDIGPNSLFTNSFKLVGLPFDEFVYHVAGLAINEK